MKETKITQIIQRFEQGYTVSLYGNKVNAEFQRDIDFEELVILNKSKK